jgi:hypothetical protein
MKRLVHLIAVMLLVGTSAVFIPSNAQAWWGGWTPWDWMMPGGWGDYYYPYYGGGYPYYGGGYYPYYPYYAPTIPKTDVK